MVDVLQEKLNEITCLSFGSSIQDNKAFVINQN